MAHRDESGCVLFAAIDSFVVACGLEEIWESPFGLSPASSCFQKDGMEQKERKFLSSRKILNNHKELSHYQSSRKGTGLEDPESVLSEE